MDRVRLAFTLFVEPIRRPGYPCTACGLYLVQFRDAPLGAKRVGYGSFPPRRCFLFHARHISAVSNTNQPRIDTDWALQMFRLTTSMIRMNTPQATSDRLTAVVAEAMRTAKVSQRAMAELTGIPLVTLSRRLNGHTAFTAV